MVGLLPCVHVVCVLLGAHPVGQGVAFVIDVVVRVELQEVAVAVLGVASVFEAEVLPGAVAAVVGGVV